MSPASVNTEPSPRSSCNRMLLLFGFLIAVAVLLASGCNPPDKPALTGEPHAQRASVKDGKVIVEFAAVLDRSTTPAPEQFTVTVAGDTVSVPVRSVTVGEPYEIKNGYGKVTVGENAVTLRLYSPVHYTDQVAVGFSNTDTADTQLRTAIQTPVSDFAGLVAHNSTETDGDRYYRYFFVGLIICFIAFPVLYALAAWLTNRK